MNKGELKAAVVYEIGCKVDDMLEGATLDVARNEGAKNALMMATKKVSNLAVEVDRELDGGDFDKLGDPMEVAKLVKKYVTRAVAILESGAAGAENHRLISQGRAQAFELMVANMKKIRDGELEKARVRETDGGSRGHAVGVEPKPSIKARRLAEDDLVSDVSDTPDTPVVKRSSVKKKPSKTTKK